MKKTKETPTKLKRRSHGAWIVGVLNALAAIIVIFIFVTGRVNLFGIIAIPGLPSISGIATPAIPDITGTWLGCIQGNLSSNETISMDVAQEDADGSFSGTFTESALFQSGSWDMYSAQVYSNNTLKFTADPVSSGMFTMQYNFTGTLTDSGMSGFVVEGNGLTNQTRQWTLSRNDGCPY